MPSLPSTVDAFSGKALGATLAADLPIGFDNHVQVSDTTDAPRKGGVVEVDDEVIYFGEYETTDPGFLYTLRRGMNGTTEADHFIGAPVMIYSYDHPTAVQAHLLNIEARLQVEEATALAIAFGGGL